jgi:hypothetical protein
MLLCLFFCIPLQQNTASFDCEISCLAYDLAGLVYSLSCFIGSPTGSDVPHQVVN